MTPMALKAEQLKKLSDNELRQLLVDIDGAQPASIHTGYLLGRLAYRIEAEILERELA